MTKDKSAIHHVISCGPFRSLARISQSRNRLITFYISRKLPELLEINIDELAQSALSFCGQFDLAGQNGNNILAHRRIRLAFAVMHSVWLSLFSLGTYPQFTRSLRWLRCYFHVFSAKPVHHAPNHSLKCEPTLFSRLPPFPYIHITHFSQ